MIVKVNAAACTGCGACVDACPMRVIELRGEVAHVAEGCSGCEACRDWCPQGALVPDQEATAALHARMGGGGFGRGRGMGAGHGGGFGRGGFGR